MINKIFENLATRIRKENGLSDVTWAVAKSCPAFLNLFMREFFKDKDFDPGKPSGIEREYPAGNNRVDFFVRNGDNSFIIENKIDDRNYHFEEYNKSFPAAGRGIIINHKIDEQSMKDANKYGFVIRQWSDFVDLLQKESFEETDKHIINGYISYVKGVCSMKDIKEIRFEKLNSLYYFSNLVEKIIREFNREGYSCALYPALTRACGDSWTGKYFTLEKGTTRIWPWFGITYEEETPQIVFSFDSDWCEVIFKKYEGKSQKGTMFDVEQWEDNAIGFWLHEKKFNEFKEGSLEQQKNILKEFFNSMIDEISKYLG